MALLDSRAALDAEDEEHIDMYMLCMIMMHIMYTMRV